MAASSRDRRPLLEFRPGPQALFEDILQYLCRIPNIGIADIERREAETDDVGRAEIADHALRDQGLHHRIAVIAMERHLAAALFRIARARESESVGGATFLDLRNEEFG